MSTRHGRVVFLEDVLKSAIEKTRDIIVEKGVNTDNMDVTAKQVGIGAVIFQELSNGKIKDYVFSWDKILNFDGETGPYVQYTYARAVSVIRKGAGSIEEVPATLKKEDLKYICGDSAYELGRFLYMFPQVIKEAADKHEPSIITRHVVDMAQWFNRFYHDEHILVDNEEEKRAKLMLTYATKQAIKNGLGLLGIEAPDRM